MRCGTCLCRSAATSEIVRAAGSLLVTSLTHVNGDIASLQTSTFTFTFILQETTATRCILYTLITSCRDVTLAGKKPFHGSTRGRRGRRRTVTSYGMVARL